MSRPVDRGRRGALQEMGVAALIVLSVLACSRVPLGDDCPDNPLRDAVRREGSVRVLVTLAVDFDPAVDPNGPEAQEQRRRIAESQDRLIAEIQRPGVEVLRRYDRVPLLALRVDEPALCHLLTSPSVRGVERDSADPPGGAA